MRIRTENLRIELEPNFGAATVLYFAEHLDRAEREPARKILTV